MAINPFKAKRDTHLYKLTGKRGETLYYGTTNDPFRRENEHRKTKPFSKLVQISKAVMTKANAEKRERSLIRNHKKKTGSTPKLNISSTGQYQYGAMKNPKKKKEILSKIKKLSKGGKK
ncbi:hypothetical protein H6501_02355 [Candidatus Woesearchaeota archaeon]|nr:hypothetical protein [Candidatus Woesearchaeota archaeon]USN44932.1 MAG: hypothetical protein H6500_03795 [Candidatus Woesearchaeota archaeon]